MQQQVIADHGVLAAFVLVGVAFVVVTLATSWLFRPHKPTPEKLSVYECGAEPIGPAWVQFRISYYVYALLFVIFDIETVFLYPWAVAFNAMGTFILIEMLVFLGILGLGLAYAWKEGALKWR